MPKFGATQHVAAQRLARWRCQSSWRTACIFRRAFHIAMSLRVRIRSLTLIPEGCAFGGEAAISLASLRACTIMTSVNSEAASASKISFIGSPGQSLVNLVGVCVVVIVLTGLLYGDRAGAGGAMLLSCSA